ncbi:putative amidoligase [Lophiotrema nucula]|uniref:Putative amidoligase n=1 Tax=Lophiotrema nucula TaxID=690887 RepID=A0A6A5YRD7_9PLEO|nr:putative amidoligase [Lophiotrema nucula]
MEPALTTVGVELELFVNFRDIANRSGEINNWDNIGDYDRNKHVRNWIAEGLRNRDLKAYVQDEPVGGNFPGWGLGLDFSVTFEKKKEKEVDMEKFYGIEIRSPILPVSIYHTEISKFYNSLTSICDIMIDAECSTHVHIRRGKEWSLDELISISRGIIRDEDEVFKHFPPQRQASDYAKRNRQNCTEPKEVEELLTEINRCSTMAEGRAKLAHLISPSKDFAWNLDNAKDAGKGYGTVEFRLPPGSSDAEGCTKWVSCVIKFVDRWTNQVSID